MGRRPFLFETMSATEYHPVANLFPLIEGQEFEDLKNDIKTNGLLCPIEVYEGKILDGRNRYRACEELGIKPEFTNFEGADPISRVVSLNLMRRHLSTSQRGMIAARVADLQIGANQHASIEATSQTVAAKNLNVGRSTVQRAETVLNQGIPKLQAKVDTGDVKVSAAAEIASQPPAIQEEIIARGEKEIIKAAREIKQRKATAKKEKTTQAAKEVPQSNSSPFVRDLAELKGQKFGCIYMDPPWSYSNQATRAATGNHYDTMSLEELALLPIEELAAEKCHLHMWTTNAYLFEGMKLMQDWGFHFKSTFVWVKPQIGMGNYWRNSHEIMLLGIRGGQRAIARDQRSWLECSRGEHSAKPEQVRRAIEQLSPGPYLELFGRGPRQGWTVFGNQIQDGLNVL